MLAAATSIPVASRSWCHAFPGRGLLLREPGYYVWLSIRASHQLPDPAPPSPPLVSQKSGAGEHFCFLPKIMEFPGLFSLFITIL